MWWLDFSCIGKTWSFREHQPCNRRYYMGHTTLENRNQELYQVQKNIDSSSGGFW